MLSTANVYICYYNGLEVCSLNMSDLRSLDFVVNRFLMKLFNTNVMDNVKICQDYFDFDLPCSVMIKKNAF